MSNLSRRQQQLYGLLLGKSDVPIPDLFFAIADRNIGGAMTLNMQYQQRYLGPYITALNRKLVHQGLRVEPGALKNTYRLVAVTA